jgi:hypothetical protein
MPDTKGDRMIGCGIYSVIDAALHPLASLANMSTGQLVN